ncbi:MAG: response regulator, partial [Pseudobdellovibrionaceae bacterium]|nr:response regulator [Pseudobdellovibrionaceae bacterium]
LLLDHDFALTLLDVQMPELNGFEVAELMRGRRESRHIPIIFVTAGASDQQQMFKGYEAGAVDFLPKPFDPAALESKVRVFVELYDARKTLKGQVEEITLQRNELARLKVAAEAANAAKSTFLSNISHEIRTPLSAILGFADLLQYSDHSPEEHADCIDVIRRNGQHLLKVINDVLDMSKIEAGLMDVELVDVALPDLLADIERALQFRVVEKSLKFSLLGNVPDFIRTDPTRLKQILINIIGNAIKFTANGTIEVTTGIELNGPNSSERKLIIAVKDSGIGLSSEQSARLFHPFVQSEITTSRKFGGTGLGLVISRQLAQALGGDVVLTKTAPGEGSTFEISIDAGPAKLSVVPKVKTAPMLPTQAIFNDLKILVVDDSRDNRTLLNRILLRLGADVDVAGDGREGMEMALKGSYDLVFMDVQMPVMDGLEATRNLRRQNFDRPIIALTAYAFEQEGARCMAAGYSDHLSKPIDYQRLIERIQHHTSVGLNPDPRLLGMDQRQIPDFRPSPDA